MPTLPLLNHFTGIPCLAGENGCIRTAPTSFQDTGPAAVRANEHAVHRGCSLKPNCDELDEKTKLSLSWGVGGVHFCVLLHCQSHGQTNTVIFMHPIAMKFSNKAPYNVPTPVWG